MPETDRLIVGADGQAPLLLARRPARISGLSRPRMGPAGRRRLPPLREDLPRGIPVGPVLAHHPAEAREFPPRLRRLRLQARSPASARRTWTRLLADAGIVRHRGKIESTINNAKRAIALTRRIRLARRAISGATSPSAKSRPEKLDWATLQAMTHDAGIDRALEGPQEARLELRRPDHRLRLHAGDGAGQRPHRRLLLPGRGRARAARVQAAVVGAMRRQPAPEGGSKPRRPVGFRSEGASCDRRAARSPYEVDAPLPKPASLGFRALPSSGRLGDLHLRSRESTIGVAGKRHRFFAQLTCVRARCSTIAVRRDGNSRE